MPPPPNTTAKQAPPPRQPRRLRTCRHLRVHQMALRAGIHDPVPFELQVLPRDARRLGPHRAARAPELHPAAPATAPQHQVQPGTGVSAPDVRLPRARRLQHLPPGRTPPTKRHAWDARPAASGSPHPTARTTAPRRAPRPWVPCLAACRAARAAAAAAEAQRPPSTGPGKPARSSRTNLDPVPAPPHLVSGRGPAPPSPRTVARSPRRSTSPGPADPVPGGAE